MNTLSENLRVLANTQPDLFQYLQDVNTDSVQIVKDRHLVIPKVNGIELRDLNYRPEEEASMFLINNRDVLLYKSVIIFGLGFAYHLNRIIEAAFMNNAKVYIIENSPAVFYKALKNVDLRTILSNSTIIIDKNPENFLYSATFHGLLNYGVGIIVYEPYKIAYTRTIQSFLYTFHNLIRYDKKINFNRGQISLQELLNKRVGNLSEVDKQFIIFNENTNYRIMVQ